MGNFSAMTVQASGSTHNSTTGASFQYNYTSSYKVLYSPKTGSIEFKANFTETQTNPAKTGIVWMHPNGTIIAVFESGVNNTGAAAGAIIGTLVSAFQLQYFYGTDLQAYTSLQGVHAINQTTVMIGPTSLSVTNYGITSPTEFCNGSGLISNTQFLIQAGLVQGTTLTLVPIWSQVGSFTPVGRNSVLSYTTDIRVISVTKA